MDWIGWDNNNFKIVSKSVLFPIMCHCAFEGDVGVSISQLQHLHSVDIGVKDLPPQKKTILILKEKCPKCHYAPCVKSSQSRDEDGIEEEEEDVIDAMLNRGRGTGKFEGPRLGMHQLYCKIGRALTKYFGVVPFQVLYSLSCLLLGV